MELFFKKGSNEIFRLFGYCLRGNFFITAERDNVEYNFTFKITPDTATLIDGADDINQFISLFTTTELINFQQLNNAFFSFTDIINKTGIMAKRDGVGCAIAVAGFGLAIAGFAVAVLTAPIHVPASGGTSLWAVGLAVGTLSKGVAAYGLVACAQE